MNIGASYEKSNSISKINCNFKNQLQFQKSITISKINYNFKNQIQFQKSITNFNSELISADHLAIIQFL